LPQLNNACLGPPVVAFTVLFAVAIITVQPNKVSRVFGTTKDHDGQIIRNLVSYMNLSSDASGAMLFSGLLASVVSVLSEHQSFGLDWRS